MKARVMMIGDYDNQSKTYAICLIADEAEVDASPLKEGDEVEIHIANMVLTNSQANARLDRTGPAANEDRHGE